MSFPALLIAVVLVLAQFLFPRRWAFVPLLIAACHTGNAATLGDFTAVRLVIAAGIARAALGGSLRWSAANPLDLLVAIFSGFALLSSIAHDPYPSSPFVYRAGLVYNILGTYLYARAFLRRPNLLSDLAQSLVIVLVPLALFMVVEQRSGRNLYAALGAKRTEAAVREDRTRAQGPFGTPILAGTAAAVAVPFFLPLWKQRRRWAVVGLGACLTMIASSASSGPIGTLLLGGGAIGLWRWRTRLKTIRRLMILGLIVLHFIKERPIWYLMALIDFVGGSTGWYRARLIDQALTHLDEWWFMGTDHTSHWMHRALGSSPNHCDLTNYYVHLGVLGGLPLMLSLIAILFVSFRRVGRRMAELRGRDEPAEFALWCVGSALFAHAVTFLSVSYFDQMFVFFWLVIGMVPELLGLSESVPARAPQRIRPPNLFQPQPTPELRPS